MTALHKHLLCLLAAMALLWPALARAQQQPEYLVTVARMPDRAQAEALVLSLDKGASLEQAARKHGPAEWFKVSSLHRAFAGPLSELSKGEYTREPISSPNSEDYVV